MLVICVLGYCFLRVMVEFFGLEFKLMIFCGCDRLEWERNEIKLLMGLLWGVLKWRYFFGD